MEFDPSRSHCGIICICLDLAKDNVTGQRDFIISAKRGICFIALSFKRIQFLKAFV